MNVFRCVMKECRWNINGFCDYNLQLIDGKYKRSANPEDALIVKFAGVGEVSTLALRCDKYEKNGD